MPPDTSSAAPPGFLELVEASLRIPFRPAETLSGLGRLPPPGYAAAAVNWLFWTALFLLVNIISTLMRLPDVSLGLLPLSLGLAVCLLASLPMGFFLAGILHVLALLSGGRGGFVRSYQTLSCLGCILPLSALMLWLPAWAWPVPTLYGSFLAIRAVENLHQAPSGQTCVILGTIGGFLTAAQIVAHSTIAHWQQTLEATMNIYSAQGAIAPGSSSPLAAEGGSTQAAAPNAAPTGAQAQSPSSSLTMIQDGAGSLPAGVVPTQLPNGPQAEQMQAAAIKLIDSVNRQLSRDPNALKKLPPAQAAQVRALMRMANQVKRQLAQPNGAAGSRENQALMQQLMRTMQMMQNPGAQDLPSVGSGKPSIPQPPPQNSGSPYGQDQP